MAFRRFLLDFLRVICHLPYVSQLYRIVVFFATWKYLLSLEFSFKRQLLWFYYQGNSCRFFFWLLNSLYTELNPCRYVYVHVLDGVVCQFLSEAYILIKFHFFFLQMLRNCRCNRFSFASNSPRTNIKMWQFLIQHSIYITFEAYSQTFVPIHNT